MIIPDFYPAFACKAGACQHSCCRQSWEIDIDAATADYYQQLAGPLGEELRQAMQNGPDGPCFAMENEQCHFLRPDGLCRLVLDLGEEALCDICALHPRFYEYLDDPQGNEYELGGVGLCCEKTCELLLKKKQPLAFYEEETGQTFPSLAALLTQFGRSTDQLVYQPFGGRPENELAAYLAKLLALFGQTEPIDADWTKQLQALSQQLPTLLPCLALKPTPQAQRIYDYLCYRQLETCPDLEKLSSYGTLNTDFIYLSAAYSGDLGESLRRWSEQIEYDTDNVDLLFSRLPLKMML